MQKIISTDKMRIINECLDEKYKLFLFIPSFIRLFPRSGNMHKMDIKQKLRFLTLLIHGYKVYVLSDLENNTIGCVTVANGKTYRYPFADENDLIIGPYFVLPEYRRQGIATRMIKCVIERYETNYNSLFAHIWHENQASVECMKKLGFHTIGTLRTTRILQTCIPDKEGKLILVRKKHS